MPGPIETSHQQGCGSKPVTRRKRSRSDSVSSLTPEVSKPNKLSRKATKDWSSRTDRILAELAFRKTPKEPHPALVKKLAALDARSPGHPPRVFALEGPGIRSRLYSYFAGKMYTDVYTRDDAGAIRRLLDGNFSKATKAYMTAQLYLWGCSVASSWNLTRGQLREELQHALDAGWFEEDLRRQYEGLPPSRSDNVGDWPLFTTLESKWYSGWSGPSGLNKDELKRRWKAAMHTEWFQRFGDYECHRRCLREPPMSNYLFRLQTHGQGAFVGAASGTSVACECCAERYFDHLGSYFGPDDELWEGADDPSRWLRRGSSSSLLSDQLGGYDSATDEDLVSISTSRT